MTDRTEALEWLSRCDAADKAAVAQELLSDPKVWPRIYQASQNKMEYSADDGRRYFVCLSHPNGEAPHDAMAQMIQSISIGRAQRPKMSDSDAAKRIARVLTTINAKDVAAVIREAAKREDVRDSCEQWADENAVSRDHVGIGLLALSMDPLPQEPSDG